VITGDHQAFAWRGLLSPSDPKRFDPS